MEALFKVLHGLNYSLIMSLASAAGVLLKPQTPLQQLLEDINFQRNKEMRQLLKDGKLFFFFKKFCKYISLDLLKNLGLRKKILQFSIKSCLYLHIIDYSRQ